MILSHWQSFTWKIFILWFHKILKLISQKLPSSPRNTCTENWRKLPNLTALLEIFLYLKNNDFVEHVQKVCQLSSSSISKVKQSFHTAFGRSGCFEFLIWFTPVLLLSEMKSLFFSHFKFAKFLISFPSNFASIFSAIKHNFSVVFKLSHYILWSKRRLSSAQVRICQIPCVNFETTGHFLSKFCITIQCHEK